MVAGLEDGEGCEEDREYLVAWLSVGNWDLTTNNQGSFTMRGVPDY